MDEKLRCVPSEEIWRKRLKSALCEYENAKLAAQLAVTELRDGTLPPSDGHFAVRTLTARETAALAEYARVLRVFTDLIAHGKRPK